MLLNSSENTFSPRAEGPRRDVFSELFNIIELFILLEKFPFRDPFVYLIHLSILLYGLQMHDRVKLLYLWTNNTFRTHVLSHARLSCLSVLIIYMNNETPLAWIIYTISILKRILILCHKAGFKKIRFEDELFHCRYFWNELLTRCATYTYKVWTIVLISFSQIPHQSIDSTEIKILYKK